jgi:hypothetical protein
MFHHSGPNYGNDFVVDTKRGVVVSRRNMTET